MIIQTEPSYQRFLQLFTLDVLLGLFQAKIHFYLFIYLFWTGQCLFAPSFCFWSVIKFGDIKRKKKQHMVSPVYLPAIKYMLLTSDCNIQCFGLAFPWCFQMLERNSCVWDTWLQVKRESYSLCECQFEPIITQTIILGIRNNNKINANYKSTPIYL